MNTPLITSGTRAILWSCAALASLQLTAFGSTLTNRYSFTTDATDSVGGQHGTLVNATVAGGQAILASPSATPSSDTVNGQYVELPDNLLTNYASITIEAWVTPNHDNFTDGAFWNRIWDFGNSDGGNGTHSFWFRGGNSTTPIGVDLFYPDNGNIWFAPAPAGILANGVESHVVFALDAVTQQAKLFVNGVEVATDNSFIPTPAGMGSTTNNWLGRSQFVADTFWMGTINEFRIYSGALGVLEVAANYEAGPDSTGNNPGTITNVMISVASPLSVGSGETAEVFVKTTGLSNPVKINDSSIAIVFSSSNPSILTVDTNGVVNGLASGIANVIATVGSLSATQAVQVIAVPTTMKHRYSFTADATDSINGKNGTLWGNATINGGKVLLDNTEGTYVDLPAYMIAPSNIVNKALTFESWATIYPAANHPNGSTWLRIFDFGNIVGGLGANYIFFAPHANGASRAAVSDTNPGYSSENGVNGADLRGRTNVHVTVVYNPNPSRAIIGLYIDGVLIGTQATTKPLSGINNAFSFLGRSTYGGDNWLAGEIDEFRIYDGELDRFQIAASRQSGPNTPNFNPGTFQSFVLSVSGSASPLSLNQVRQLGAILNFSAATNINVLGDANLTLTSSDTNVLAITSPGGLITANGVGSATVAASYRRVEGAVTNLYTQTTNLTVVAPVATLAHRYSFNEGAGNTVFDLVGTAHGLVRAGTNELGVTNAAWAGGRLYLNTNIALAATDTYVDLPSGMVSGLGSDATFEVWATVQSGGGWHRVFDFGSIPASPTNAAAPNVFLSRGSGNSTPMYNWVNGSISANAAWNNGETAHFVVTHSGTDGSARMYRNGVLVAGSATQNLPLNSINDIYCFLGRSIYSWPISQPGGYFDPYFVGAFDEFRIYQGLLTAQQIAANYAAGPNQLVSAAPKLTYTVSGNTLNLLWPTNVNGALYGSALIGTGANWLAVGGAPTVTGTNYQLSVPMTNSAHYYRLQ